jgi:hypothetical protein
MPACSTAPGVHSDGRRLRAISVGLGLSARLDGSSRVPGHPRPADEPILGWSATGAGLIPDQPPRAEEVAPRFVHWRGPRRASLSAGLNSPDRLRSEGNRFNGWRTAACDLPYPFGANGITLEFQQDFPADVGWRRRTKAGAKFTIAAASSESEWVTNDAIESVSLW